MYWKLARGDAAADGDVLRRLQEQVRALDLGELRPQPVDDLRCRELALVARLEHDEEAAGIGGLGAAGAAGERAEAGDVRIAQQDVAELADAGASSRSGEMSCAASAKPEIRPVSWIGKKPLGIVTVIDRGQRHGGEEHARAS